jgi:hypothetical protein
MRTFNRILVIVAVLAIAAVAVALLAPGFVQSSRETIRSVSGLFRADRELEGVAQELPFTPPQDDLASPEQLARFLAVRRAFQQPYEAWSEVVRRAEAAEKAGWSETREVLTATSDTMRFQIETLRAHRMSPAEFLWLEGLIYRTWLPGTRARVRDQAAADLARSDLEFLADVERRHGRSAALREVRGRFEERLHQADGPSAPAPEDPNHRLFWEHRDEIEVLDLGDHPIHARLRGGDIEIKLDRQRGRKEATTVADPSAVPRP